MIQVYEGLVSMDFAEERMETLDGLGCAAYEPLDPRLLPPLYVAYNTEASEPTEVIHNNLRARYNQGEPAVLEAMRRLVELTVDARLAILNRNAVRLGELVDANFDIRRSILRLPPEHVEMIEHADRPGSAPGSPAPAARSSASARTKRPSTISKRRWLPSTAASFGRRPCKPAYGRKFRSPWTGASPSPFCPDYSWPRRSAAQHAQH